MSTEDWIAVDWGTTRLRAWLMKGPVAVKETCSDQGMSSLSSPQFETALLRLIDDWLSPRKTTKVVCCGMVGSRQGWKEAPYAQVPCAPATGACVQADTTDPRLSVFLLPGLSQSKPADVMRGEETQIAGFLSLNDGWDGVVCLPGTHSKWAHISAGEVISFQTFMTGELFGLLSENSVLRHSVATEDWDEDAFNEGLSDTLTRPESVAARLFRLRADQLLNNFEKGATRAKLSGLLIGAELSAARPYWLGQNIAVVGETTLAATYVAALATQGVNAIQARVDAMTLAGLTSAYRTLKDKA